MRSLRCLLIVCAPLSVGACSHHQDLKVLDHLLDAGGHDAAMACADAGRRLGAVCSVGAGSCQRAGTYLCDRGAVRCSATAGISTTELCDTQRDEDCDGKIDEAPDGGCCHSADCDELHTCSRPSDDALAAGTCVAFARPNADCKKNGDEVACMCQPGYDGDGQTCIRNPCVAIRGEDPPCGEHQSCALTKKGEKSCSCAEGFADCDQEPTNGCEVSLATDPEHCGDCGRSCAIGVGCADSACGSRVAAISLGFAATLAIKLSGDVLGAGAAALLHGQSSATKTFVLLSSLGKAKQLSAGVDHACLLRENGAATCWGNNQNYAIGSTDKAATYDDLPVTGALAISTGDTHTCLVSEQGRVYCFGTGLSGELGDGVTRDRSYQGRTLADAMAGTADNAVRFVEKAIDVAAGMDLNCALTSEKLVYCWGLDGASGNAYVPELVRDESGSPLTDAVALAGGYHHACALRGDTTAACWGSGPLGTGAMAPPRNQFVSVALSNVKSIASGATHVCALLGDGTVRCWGQNTQGQLGTGDTHASSTPVPVLMPDRGAARALYSGGFSGGTCMEAETGKVYCWGYNTNGQLGLGGGGSAIPTPTEVTAWP